VHARISRQRLDTGVIALFPTSWSVRQRESAPPCEPGVWLACIGLAGRDAFGEMMEVCVSVMTPMWSPSMIHHTPSKTLLTTTFQSLVMQLSGLLAQGTRLLARFINAESTPATTMAFERALSRLLTFPYHDFSEYACGLADDTRENALFSSTCTPTSLKVVPCQDTATASAPHAPGYMSWFVPPHKISGRDSRIRSR
jgi:hypothetical protein